MIYIYIHRHIMTNDDGSHRARSARRRRELASREFLLILLSCRELKSTGNLASYRRRFL